MNIYDAVKNANGKSIRRGIWPKDWYIIPTNSDLCCIAITKNDKSPRWESKEEDLIADDWEIM